MADVNCLYFRNFRFFAQSCDIDGFGGLVVEIEAESNTVSDEQQAMVATRGKRLAGTRRLYPIGDSRASQSIGAHNLELLSQVLKVPPLLPSPLLSSKYRKVSSEMSESKGRVLLAYSGGLGQWYNIILTAEGH